MGGTIDVHDYPLSRYNYTTGEDRQEVAEAREESQKNPSARKVLVANRCLQHNQSAEKRLRACCPTLAALTPTAVPRTDPVEPSKVKDGGTTSDSSGRELPPLEVITTTDTEGSGEV